MSAPARVFPAYRTKHSIAVSPTIGMSQPINFGSDSSSRSEKRGSASSVVVSKKISPFVEIVEVVEEIPMDWEDRSDDASDDDEQPFDSGSVCDQVIAQDDDYGQSAHALAVIKRCGNMSPTPEVSSDVPAIEAEGVEYFTPQSRVCDQAVATHSGAPNPTDIYPVLIRVGKPVKGPDSSFDTPYGTVVCDHSSANLSRRNFEELPWAVQSSLLTHLRKYHDYKEGGFYVMYDCTKDTIHLDRYERYCCYMGHVFTTCSKHIEARPFSNEVTLYQELWCELPLVTLSQRLLKKKLCVRKGRARLSVKRTPEPDSHLTGLDYLDSLEIPVAPPPTRDPAGLLALYRTMVPATPGVVVSGLQTTSGSGPPVASPPADPAPPSLLARVTNAVGWLSVGVTLGMTVYNVYSIIRAEHVAQTALQDFNDARDHILRRRQELDERVDEYLEALTDSINGPFTPVGPRVAADLGIFGTVGETQHPGVEELPDTDEDEQNPPPPPPPPAMQRLPGAGAEQETFVPTSNLTYVPPIPQAIDLKLLIATNAWLLVAGPVLGCLIWYRAEIYATVVSFYNLFCIFCTIRRRTHETHSMLKRVHKDLAHWKHIIGGLHMEGLSADDKVLLLDVKTAVHCLYHLYHGHKSEVIEWASNYLVTRSEMMASVVALPYQAIAAAVANPVAHVTLGGREIAVDSKTHSAMQAHYNEYGDLVEFECFETTANSLTGLMSSLFANWELSGISPEQVKNMNNQFVFLNNSKKRAEESFGALQILISVIGRTAFGVDPFDPDYQRLVTDVLQIIEFVAKLRLRLDELPTNSVLITEVLTRYELSCNMINDPRLDTLPTHLKNFYTRIHLDLTNYAQRCKGLQSGGTRVEPVFVMVSGPPGVGKTALIKYTQSEILRLEGKQYEDNMTFSKPQGSEYWEGYGGQRFVVMDDIWMTNDLQLRAAETGMIINMVNTAPYMLNMAFDGKGTTPFRSRMIFATTNAFSADGINSTELHVGATDQKAVKRRMTIVLHRVNPIGEELMDCDYRVDQCPIEGYVGKKLNPVEVADLIVAVDKWKAERATAYAYTHERLLEMRALHDARRAAELAAREGEPLQPQADTDLPYSPLQVFLKSCELGIYDWLDKKYYPYYALLLSLLLAAAFAKPVMEYLFPFTPTSEMKGGRAYRKYWGEEVRGHKLSKKKLNELWRTESNTKYIPPPHTFTPTAGLFDYHKSLANNLCKSVVHLAAETFTDSSMTSRLKCSSAMGTHLRDGAVITVAHWFSAFYNVPNTVLHVVVGGRHYQFPFPDQQQDCIEVETLDLVVFKLPKACPLPTQIYKYIVSYSTGWDVQAGTSLNLLVVDDASNPTIRTVTKAVHSSTVRYDSGSDWYVVENPLGYFCRTIKGDSGSMLVAAGKDGTPTILGMHVGTLCKGGSEIGISLPICREFVDSLLKALDTPVTPLQVTSGEFVPASLGSNYSPDPALERFPLLIKEVVHPGLGHRLNQKSSLRRSALYGWDGPATFVPAMMKPTMVNGVLVDPIEVAYKKIQQVEVPGFEFPPATQDYLQHLYPREPAMARLLTMDESLNGVSGWNCPRIHMSTSAGYPFSLNNMSSKRCHIDEDENHHLTMKPSLARAVDDMLGKLKSGQPIRVIYADNFKDETRPIEKRDLGKTRNISSCPADALIVGRMLFGAHVAYVQQHCVTKPVAVGINVHSVEWAQLRNRLDTHRESVLSGDFANFDGKLPAFVTREYVKYVNWWYNDGPVLAKARELYVESIVNAEHILFNVIYQARGGRPSGDFLTAIGNSFGCLIMIHYVLTQKFGLQPTQFQLATYGDDNVITASVADITYDDIAREMKSCFNMDYTDWRKGKVLIKDSMDTISFLGRMFAGLLAPLNQRSSSESVYWVRGSDTEAESLMIASTTTMFLEWSHYPREVFEFNRQKLHEFMSRSSKMSPGLAAAISANCRSYQEYFQSKYVCDTSTLSLPSYMCEREGPRPTVKSAGLDLDGAIDCEVDGSRGYKFLVTSSSHPTRDMVRETDNEGFEARAVRDEPPATQLDQLGSWHDTTEVTENPILYTGPAPRESNLECFDMNKTIDRVVNIVNAGWTVSQSSGVQLFSVSLPGDILLNNYMNHHTRGYRYMRCRIRLTFRVMAPKTAYGLLMAQYTPIPSQDTFPATEIFRASGSPHILISASASEVATMDIPFVYWYRYYNLGTGAANDLGSVVVWVVAPLTSISAEVASARIQVSAQFLECELYYPEASGQLSATAPADDFVLTSGDYTGHKSGTTGHTTMVKNGQGDDINTGVGQSLVAKLTRYPNAGLKKIEGRAGEDCDETIMHNIIGVPMLTTMTLYGSGTTPKRLCNLGPAASTENATFVDTMMAMHQSWSGSFKVKVYIVASTFHKVQLAFHISGTSLATISSTEWYDTYHRVVDVSGDTDIEFMLPYLENTQLSPTNTIGTYNLVCTLVSWSVPDPSIAAAITVLTYKAAGEDFELTFPLDNQFTPTSNPRYEFKERFEPFHPSMRPYTENKEAMVETYDSLLDHLRAYHPYGQTLSSIPVWYVPGPGLLTLGIEKYSLFYRFRRGSVRFKLLQKDTTFTAAYVSNTSSQAFDTFMTVNRPDGSTDFEIPSLGTLAFSDATKSSNSSVVFTAGSGIAKYYCKSVGDDFQLFHLRAYPAGSFGFSVSSGVRGLVPWGV